MMRNQFGAVPGAKTVGLDDSSDDESTPSQNEEEYLISQRTVPETKRWNIFRDPPVKTDSGSEANPSWLETTLKIIKVIVYLVVFVIVLASSVVAIGTTLFMTSQIRANRTVLYCNQWLGSAKSFIVTLPEAERISWIWCIIIAFMIPEIGTLVRSVRICCFKTQMRASVYHAIFVAIMETFHVIGLAIIFMGILPDLNVIQGAMLTNAVCFVPGVLSLFSRIKKCDESKEYLLMLLDSAAVAAQMSAFVVWPFLYSSNRTMGLLPIALIMVSCGWWENYVPVKNTTCLMRILSQVKEGMQSRRYSTYVFVSIWKMIVFIVSSMTIFHLKGETITYLFTMFGGVFSDRNITIIEAQSIVGGGTIPDLSNVLPDGVMANMVASFATPIYVLLIQVLSTYFAYIFGKFACKVLIQGFSYALPVNLAIPVSISLLIAACALRNTDPCAFSGTIPDYLFFESSGLSNLSDFIFEEYAWVWLLWLLSQMWITVHICTPKCEVLTPTEKLFITPMYSGLLINQSMGMNRNREDEPEISKEGSARMEKDRNDSDDEITDEDSTRRRSEIKKSDKVTKIYACATMWHEKKNEMLDFLKSILRMDHDQCARKIAQKFLKMPVPDYYEFETHIFFDDAFEVSDHDENESQVNRFVKLLVDVLDEAASEVHRTRVRVRAPKKCPTPYGGRLIWTLPGDTKMIAHLKDTSIIRHRKRWSQVMYMYYLLGYRIMDLPISIPRKEVIAENTYLLTLDGDIDFQPSAVMRLVDLMKKNPNLGAACGRIHPMGSGPMVWYQMFEYAIGHWLQKATEHVIGCVLCSPGCFSLFRAKALMDDSVLKKYTTLSTEARHYVQYDQGEDRWLCTLLLQRGYRVEYSAASDAYTHAPETFYDFFIQRRRWISSTMANIMDLIMHSKRTIKNNDDISTLYMCYQVMLMIGTILGPGTIFLMLIGAFGAAFQIGIMTSFYYNIVPVLLFIIVCFTCKTDVQISVAAVISVVYGLVMMAVIVGILIQMAEDGWMAPSSLFLFLIFGQLVIAGFMHPHELNCLPCGLIYYVTIPSMYLLLVIYCIVNLNIVTWGTRETKTKKTLAELEDERKELEEAKEKVKNKSFLGLLKNGQHNDGRGSLEFSLAGLCKCMLCTHGKPSDENLRLIAIADGLEQVITRLDTIDSKPNNPQESGPAWMRGPRLSRLIPEPMNHIAEDPGDDDEQDSDTATTVSQITETNRRRNYLISPYWLDGEGLKKGEPDYLKAREEKFWEDMIEEYLYPIDDNKAEKERIASDLKNLRNNCALAFFMLNAIFVVIIFLMQLNQELLHIVWPFGARNAIAFDGSSLEVHIAKEYLQLEPIGLLFVVFFGVILVIQFIAMLFHRLGTFEHIIANTKLQWIYCCKTPEDLSQEDLIKRDAVEIVKGFQRMDSVEANYGENGDVAPGRRKTIRNLEKSRRRTQNFNINLVDTFHKRYSMSEGSDFPASMPRTSTKALNAFMARRSTVISERRRSRMTGMGGNHLHEIGGNRWTQQLGTSRDSHVSFHDNVARSPSGVDNSAFEFEESLPDSVNDRRVSFQTPR